MIFTFVFSPQDVWDEDRWAHGAPPAAWTVRPGGDLQRWRRGLIYPHPETVVCLISYTTSLEVKLLDSTALQPQLLKVTLQNRSLPLSASESYVLYLIFFTEHQVAYL